MSEPSKTLGVTRKHKNTKRQNDPLPPEPTVELRVDFRKGTELFSSFYMAWIKGNDVLAAKREGPLADWIKIYLPGVIIEFCDLVFWVDAETPDGKVDFRKSGFLE